MSLLAETARKHRSNSYDSHELFLNRWSPRAMTGEEVDETDLMAMFEAAHWAPSAYNNQPWRFIFARRSQPEWTAFLDFLVEGNRTWCERAGALIVIVSKTTFDHNGKPMLTHAFDTGSAWGMMALEGARRGLVVHGMQGFDYEKARAGLGVPEGYEVQAMAAVGIMADRETLPTNLAEIEKPSGRKDLARLAAPGRFTDDVK